MVSNNANSLDKYNEITFSKLINMWFYDLQESYFTYIYLFDISTTSIKIFQLLKMCWIWKRECTFWLNVVLFFWIKFITVIIWNDDMNFKEYILHIDMHFKSCLPVWRNILINWIGRIWVLGMKEDILILVWLMFCLEYNDDNDEMDDGTKNGSKALFWKLLIKSKID